MFQAVRLAAPRLLLPHESLTLLLPMVDARFIAGGQYDKSFRLYARNDVDLS